MKVTDRERMEKIRGMEILDLPRKKLSDEKLLELHLQYGTRWRSFWKVIFADREVMVRKTCAARKERGGKEICS